MMLASNTTPFAALGFEQAHRDGDAMAVTVVRGRFILTSRAMSVAAEQSLVLADTYDGPPDRSPLLRGTDLVPFRPCGDLTVLANAYPPGGTPTPSWEVGVTVGAIEKRLRVHGPRFWESNEGEGRAPWIMGRAEPVSMVPLDFRLASGGRFVGDPQGNGDSRNPIGPGLIHKIWTPRGYRLPAPRIEDWRTPVSDPFAMPEPVGLGPVPPYSAFRSRHAGTYDDAWKAKQSPRLPEDFDYSFYQSAPPGLTVPGHFKANDIIETTGLIPGGGRLAIVLPDFGMAARYDWRGGGTVTVRLHLDGVHLDLRDPGAETVDLTWRGWVPVCSSFLKIDLFSAPSSSLRRLSYSDADGLVLGEDEA